MDNINFDLIEEMTTNISQDVNDDGSLSLVIEFEENQTPEQVEELKKLILNIHENIHR